MREQGQRDGGKVEILAVKVIANGGKMKIFLGERKKEMIKW